MFVVIYVQYKSENLTNQLPMFVQRGGAVDSTNTLFLLRLLDTAALVRAELFL